MARPKKNKEEGAEAPAPKKTPKKRTEEDVISDIKKLTAELKDQKGLARTINWHLDKSLKK